MIPRSSLKWLLVSVLLVVVLVPVSTLLLGRLEGYSEGLEIIAEKLGLSESRYYTAPLHDYKVPFIENEVLSTIISGILGLVLTLILVLILSRVLRGKTS